MVGSTCDVGCASLVGGVYVDEGSENVVASLAGGSYADEGDGNASEVVASGDAVGLVVGASGEGWTVLTPSETTADSATGAVVACDCVSVTDDSTLDEGVICETVAAEEGTVCESEVDGAGAVSEASEGVGSGCEVSATCEEGASGEAVVAAEAEAPTEVPVAALLGSATVDASAAEDAAADSTLSDGAAAEDAAPASDDRPVGLVVEEASLFPLKTAEATLISFFHEHNDMNGRERSLLSLLEGAASDVVSATAVEEESVTLALAEFS